MPGPAEIMPAKRAYRRREVCRMYSVSLRLVDGLVRSGKVRTRRVGKRTLLLCAEDVERELSFDVPEIDPETQHRLRRLLA